MAITQIKSTGIANGAITTQQLAPGVGAGPTITQIQITDSSYNVLDDTAVSTSGGYIKITGTNFSAGAIVVIDNINAISTTFISSTVLNVQVPSAVAGTYTVYVVNTTGSTAIGVNGLTYSGTPNWVTGSTLPNGVSNTPISIQLSATGDAPLTYALAAGNVLPDGLTLSSGGLLSGTVNIANETVYAFTIIATDAEAQDSPRAFTITISVGDPYFYLTTLLLPGNGTNNGTNNTFLDSSTNNFTVTRNGNTTQGTFTPFSLTGWSNYFDGTGDSLTTATNAAVAPTADFTIECWFYTNTLTSTNGGGVGVTFIGNSTLNDGRLQITVQTTGQITLYLRNNSAVDVITVNTATGLVAINVWYHLACVRSGNAYTIYLNGVSVGTGTSATAMTYAANICNIGFTRSSNLLQNWNGYISNFRLINGTAVYTTNFTPSIVPLTAIANTAVLTCQSNRFIDNSTNNFTITRNGDTSVQSFSPFAPGANYSTSTVGGSAYFDGTSDTLVIPYSATLAAGTGPYCFEAWVYFTTSGGTQGIIGTSSDGFAGFERNTGSWGYYVGGSGINTGVTAVGGQWNHVVVCRDNSSNFGFFVNGVRLANGTDSQNKQNFGNPTVGYNGIGTHFTGYISDYRYVKGATPYNPLSSTITVPTAPLTAISGTTILLSATNGQIIDATSKNDLETVGDAKISTTQSKWGGSSMYFDGTGDWLQIPYNEYYNIGSSNYTVEAWIKTTVTTGEIVSAFSSSSPFPGWLFGIGFNNNDGKLKFYNANGSSSESFTSTGTVNNNNWNHVAVTKSGTSLQFFINGTLDSTHTMTIVGTGSNQPVLIGADNNPSKGRYYTGYINDLRITKGYARYTTNFTPPTSAFPTL